MRYLYQLYLQEKKEGTELGKEANLADNFDYAENLAKKQNDGVVSMTPETMQEGDQKLVRYLNHLSKQLKRVELDINKHKVMRPSDIF